MDIYDRINFQLKKQKKTRKEMSEETGISYFTISSMFQRRSKSMSIESLVSISKFLNMSTDYLLFGDEGIRTITDYFEIELISLFKNLSKQKKYSLMEYAANLLRAKENE